MTRRGSSRTTGTVNAWETGRRGLLMMMVMVLAEAAAVGTVSVVCAGVDDVDQRGVHDTRNPPAPAPRSSGGWQAYHRVAALDSGIYLDGWLSPRHEAGLAAFQGWVREAVS